jgi:pyruvate,water dikinase
MVYAGSGSKKDSTTKTIETSKRERRSYVLEEDEVFTLARWAKIIEEHYEKPMDMEWAKDGRSGELFIVQARPETVHSQKSSGMLKTYSLKEKGDIRIEGVAIGQAIATGTAQVLNSADDQDQFEEGSILVTPQTDPDWVPVMKKAAGIVTDHGGRTSHAAIVSRELGIPAVVGTGDATDELSDGEEITLSCAEGEAGRIYDGILEFEEREVDLGEIPGTRTGILMNIASPAAAMKWWQLPVKGIGLVRMEFLINNVIKIHPLALTRFDDLEDKDAKKQIRALTADYEDRAEYFVETLARGIAQIAAPRHPDPVIVRLSDFKTNEYADLIGGAQFEPEEENPMMGFRGASRYYSEHYRDGFALECRALRRVRDEVGFRNVVIMVPFCRTPEEADRVLSTLAENGLVRGEGGLEIYMMSEVPSNVFLAKEFAARFDGFSIGSNDLTQLVLGVDRDSEELRDLFEERDPAVQTAIRHVIDEAHAAGIKVGICGQGPSDKPDFAEFLVRCGIDTMSLNPDSVLRTLELVARLEQDQHVGTA